jgi:hypothetical protein
MLCRQGPLDGCDIPDTGREFFLFTTYDNSTAGPLKLGTAHVYGNVGTEWHYQLNTTRSATKGLHDKRKKGKK